jgi:energy-coupling factor transport system ATP-binding protein
MISLRDVSVAFLPDAPNSRTVLHSVSLDIGRGEWVALVGPNGSGKTTLLHTIAGLVVPTWGRLECAPGVRTALLLQEPDNQFVTTSVRHELALSLPDEATGGEGDDRIRSAVERFGLSPLLERNPHRLSGGEKQRLALATVWLSDPALLLLDEPTAYLDREATVLCMSFVEDVIGGGTAVVWATPGGEELDRAGRVVCLEEGLDVYDGPVDGFYGWASETGFDYVSPPLRRLASEIAAAVSAPEATAGIAGSVVDGVDGLARAIAPLVADGVVEDAVDFDPGGGAAKSECDAVRFTGVSFGYGGQPAVAGLDFTVGEGECVGLAGPNGAGKSTVLGLAAGLFEPDAGEVARGSGRGDGLGSRDVFLLFQSPERMFFAESVAEELGFGLDRLGVSAGERELRSRSALQDVGLPPEAYLTRAPLTLSLGEMRRVAFAIALSLAPRLLLLDEPTSCLDACARAVLESIVASRGSRGETTVLASHDEAFLAGVCNRILWLRGGKVETELTTAHARLSPGAVWPGEPLAVLDLQDRLIQQGVKVIPRVLTAGRLAERLR